MTYTPPPYASDFFVVGAAKAGATAVYHWLSDHPDVFLPSVKEPGFFAFATRPPAPAKGPCDPAYVDQVVTDGPSYAALYESSGPRRTGDVSPIYLLDEAAPVRIADARPDARIIILLRDPVERAFSQFMHHTRDGIEPCKSFDAALVAEEERLRDGWSWGHGYATHGHYTEQVERYLAVFAREQILFLDYQDLQDAPEACWERICDHLMLGHRPLIRNERVNATADLLQVSSRPGLTRRLRHPGKLQTLVKLALPTRLRARIRPYIEGRGRPVPKLSPGTRKALAMQYADAWPRLEAMSGLLLSHWLPHDGSNSRS
ncbi:hypothetical protein EU805_16615 [Salipiger sp. IMCC34102]|uniref:sulfotransferase n=1 Tax=Salipiger sp. IMCC34102 TaxID=2510647 RepID=UPI00101CB86C|nr:sulfotransferase [Salipiger sp. IMCC34102]RYH00830.1 hypothetical protein EU805_16615 [Salipiger sp. IMCC34102]